MNSEGDDDPENGDDESRPPNRPRDLSESKPEQAEYRHETPPFRPPRNDPDPRRQSTSRRGTESDRRPERRPERQPPTHRPHQPPSSHEQQGHVSQRRTQQPTQQPRRQTTQQPGPHPPANVDPVKQTYAGRVDLYDIATWEVRTPLDSVAVSVTNGIRAVRSALLVGLALTLFLGQVVVAGVLIVAEPLLAVLAVLSVIPALVLAGYIWYGDPTAKEPFMLLAMTFLLSMLFASFAAVVNTTVFPVFETLGLVGLTLFFFLVVGPIEELVKWLAIRVHAYKSDVFQTVVDGAVYGAVAGLGFAAIENLMYITTVYLEMAPTGTGTQSQYATFVATQRAFVGPGHVIFSAWAGFYLGLAKFNPSHRGPIIVKGLLVAAFIHALYNTLVTTLPELLPLTVGGLFGFIVLYHGFWFGLLYRKISRYRELYQRIEPPGYPREDTR